MTFLKNSEALLKKWDPILKQGKAITEDYKREVTARVMENIANETAGRAGSSMVTEDLNSTTGVQNWDPVVIAMVRRALPSLIAFDVMGVQPLDGPSGLIFSLKAHYNSQTGPEALFNEADTDFSGTGAHNDSDPFAVDGLGNSTYTTGAGLATGTGEVLGSGANPDIAMMGFSINKISVEARTRKLRADFTHELEQDLRRIHGLSADGVLANLLATELITAINRESIRSLYRVARVGAQNATVPGVFDMNVDSDGRWSVEQFKGLLFQIEKDANVVGHETRRARGNILITSANVASALSMAGVLDFSPALSESTNLVVDDQVNTFAGTMLNGRYRVYVDPYVTSDLYMVGYRGSHPFDAGLFYCPYIPLMMTRTLIDRSHQPSMSFSTRYGLVSNPFVTTTFGGTVPDGETLTPQVNPYYRLSQVVNL